MRESFSPKKPVEDIQCLFLVNLSNKVRRFYTFVYPGMMTKLSFVADNNYPAE